MNRTFTSRSPAFAILLPALFFLPGITECNATCPTTDAQGNVVAVECLSCSVSPAPVCAERVWNLPVGDTCTPESQPLFPNGTPCDDGTSSGVCIAGTCVASLSCEVAAFQGTQACLRAANSAWQSCYASSGGPCAETDPGISDALSDLDTLVRASCSDGDFNGLNVDALVGRLQTSCSSEAASLASRSFGGPHGAVWATADSSAQACVLSAHQNAATLVDDILTANNNCLASGSCDPLSAESTVQSLVVQAEADVGAACPSLQSVLALQPADYVSRAHHQADCVLATSNQDTTPLDISCGPSRIDSIPARGQYVQIVLDGQQWGTKCGDGSPYAFQLWLPPEGQPLDRVLIGMQGGGVCIFGADCEPVWNNNPGLFEALSDQAPTGGIMSTNPSVSDFANWTKVFLPYCTQDVFGGGGATQVFPNFSVERYGAVNTRAAVEYVRDLLWLLLDQDRVDGYRPDQMVAAFGGWSAGGFGTIYNYHWMLDDLQWPHTTGLPDAGLALDSGDPVFSLRNLAPALLGLWNATRSLPPYCFDWDCVVGPDLYAATAPRLKAVPNQQLLVLTNQNDGVQVNTTYFPSTAAWINEMRSSVCDTRDLNGIHYYLTSNTSSVHVVSTGSLWSQSVDSEVMADWVWNAVIGAPEVVVDRMEEGNFGQAFPGVAPFPCMVAP